MDIEEKKNKLIKKEISILNLSSDEVKIMHESLKKDLDLKKEELVNLNNKIKEMKVKIDNWSN